MSVAPAASDTHTPYRPSVRFVGLMGAMAALGAISIDMYLPALPEVAADLGASTGAVQLTISGVLIGAGVGQLVVGPLSDRFGRRTPALVGIAVHVVASLLCIVAPTVEALIALRMLQGLGNSAATVTAMAVIRDRLHGGAAARVLSRLLLVIGVAPLLAPTVGGLIGGVAGWRGVFAALAVLGLGLLVVVWKFLPETHPEHARAAPGLGVALRGYRSLLADRRFMALALLPGLALSTVVSYVAAAPFVLQLGYGLTEGEFALVFAVNGAGVVLASQVNAALLRRLAPAEVLRVVLPAAVGVAVVVLVVAATRAGGLLGLLVPLWVLLSLHVFIAPNAKALALTLRGERAGTAAALAGALTSGVAGLVSMLVGVAGGDATAMAGVITGALLTALVVAVVGTPAYRRHGTAASASEAADSARDDRAPWLLSRRAPRGHARARAEGRPRRAPRPRGHRASLSARSRTVAP